MSKKIKPKHSKSGDDNWLCEDCGKDCFVGNVDYYMVKHDIWHKYGLGESRGMLCMSCIEERIGHKLTKDDILDCPLTRHYNPYTSKILNS